MMNTSSPRTWSSYLTEISPPGKRPIRSSPIRVPMAAAIRRASSGCADPLKSLMSMATTRSGLQNAKVFTIGRADGTATGTDRRCARGRPQADGRHPDTAAMEPVPP